MPYLDSSFTVALGWTLIHALWQCAAVAASAWMGFRILRNRGAQARYLLGCLALGLMLALPVATLFGFWQGPSAGAAGSPSAGPAVLILRSSESLETTGLRPWLPWVIAAWTAGVCVMTLRLAGGWFWIQRLRWVQTEPAEPVWQARLTSLARQLGIRRSLRLLKSGAVEVPMVLGWLRPVILVPVAIFTAMEPRALEAILAHELAHIRRHDYFVNLLQSAVEVLLFFHPAVWWLSAQVRAERENCCDDTAIALCGDPLFYARALEALEELRPALQPNPSLALAATGGTLMHRIRRILAPKLPPSPAARAGLLAALAVSVLGAASTFGLRPQEAHKPTAPAKEVQGEKKSVTVLVDGDAKAPRKLKIEMKGKMKIQPESEPPVALEEGARLEIEGRDGEHLRSYLAERSADGEKRIWTLEGREQMPDAQAQAWLKKSLESAQKYTFRWDARQRHGSDLEFRWKARGAEVDKELQSKARLLEEKAKLLAEKRASKGISESEVARLQEEVASQAQEVAAEARKLAASETKHRENIRMILMESKAHRQQAKEAGEEVRKEIQKRITVKGSPRDGEPVMIFTDGEGSDTVHLEMEAAGEGKPMIIKRHDIRGPEGEIMVFRAHGEDSKHEIDALKKAIQKMQERLDKLQKESPKAAPTK